MEIRAVRAHRRLKDDFTRRTLCLRDHVPSARVHAGASIETAREPSHTFSQTERRERDRRCVTVELWARRSSDDYDPDMLHRDPGFSQSAHSRMPRARERVQDPERLGMPFQNRPESVGGQVTVDAPTHLRHEFRKAERGVRMRAEDLFRAVGDGVQGSPP